VSPSVTCDTDILDRYEHKVLGSEKGGNFWGIQAPGLKLGPGKEAPLWTS
jgi:hypothetical protein